MGSKPSKESYTPEWPIGSQEMRAQLYPYLVKGLRGELTPGQMSGMASQEDAVRNESAIARERLLRDIGRMPGVPGPERYEGMRRLQEAQVRAMAGIQGQTRVNAQQQAMQQAMTYAMQQSATRGKATGPQKGFGEQLMEAGGTAAGMYMGGGMGGGMGGQMGSGGGTPGPMATGDPSRRQPQGWDTSSVPQGYQPALMAQ